MIKRTVLFAVFGSFIMVIAGRGLAEAGLITRDEALKAAFPGASIESKVIFLTEAEVKTVAMESGSEIPTALVAMYRAIQDGKTVGWAYLDTHVIRTKKQSLLVILHPEGKVKRVELVAFLEPPEYIPPDRWYAEFENKQLTNDLQVNRQIHSVTGATLTAHATTIAIRRVLAVHRVLQQRDALRQKETKPQP